MSITELEKCINMYGNDIYAFCLHLVYNQHEAEELYQDTFLKAMELLDGIEAGSNPKSYLLSITIRLWKNRKRKYAWRRRIAGIESLAEDGEEADIGSGYSLEEEVLRKEQARQLRRAVSALDEKYRLPVYLYYMEDMAVSEIAGILKIPKGTVKSRLYKAREILKEKLAADE
ncbi:MAG TPA: RNA polymerase subunit sigma-70 [Lachnospiraceae bacterium]|nr:RNA polymerase subunit sigma-70 [Lachnospiraceae bacterium]